MLVSLIPGQETAATLGYTHKYLVLINYDQMNVFLFKVLI
jgi:hypothetical protein